MITNKWVRGYFYAVALAMMLLFGYLALESYGQGLWIGLGTAIGWCFIGAWMFFGVAYTPSKQVRVIAGIRIAKPSETANRAVFYPMGQYVYLIQDTSITGYFKIGKTNHPSRRMNEFGVKLPMDLVIVHIIPCENMSQLESRLHNRFALKRVRGEWFSLSSEDIDYIKSL